MKYFLILLLIFGCSANSNQKPSIKQSIIGNWYCIDHITKPNKKIDEIKSIENWEITRNKISLRYPRISYSDGKATLTRGNEYLSFEDIDYVFDEGKNTITYKWKADFPDITENEEEEDYYEETILVDSILNDTMYATFKQFKIYKKDGLENKKYTENETFPMKMFKLNF